MGVVSMVTDHRAADDDVSQLTQDIEKNYRCKSYTPYQRLFCWKLFSFVQVLVVHLMSSSGGNRIRFVNPVARVELQ